MKLILSGSTGFIGGEVLSQAIANTSITSIVCLTRRALPEPISSNQKVEEIIVSDFTNYSPEILAQLRGSAACIWSMGSPAMKSPDLETSRRVEIDFTHAAAKACAEHLAPALSPEGSKFRFVYLSGMGANRDTNKALWFLKNTRNIKGEVENGLLEIQKRPESAFQVSIVRPGGVLTKGNRTPDILVAASMSIRVEELAAAMLNEVLANVNGTRTLECDTLRNEGRRLLEGGQ